MATLTDFCKEWAVNVAGLFIGLLALAVPPASQAAGAQLTVATWNMEWLMAPSDHADLTRSCQHQQPRSQDRALPCGGERQAPPARTQADLDALARTAQKLQALQVDVVALQEVDGAQAAKSVFRQGWQLACFSKRPHPQKVGYAIRHGVPFQCHREFTELDVDGRSRPGADLTLYPNTPQAVRMLNVHLKSGCAKGRLDRSHTPCKGLQRQAAVVEQWIDQRVREGTPFMLLGDFNRQLAQDERHEAGPNEQAPINLLPAWSDNQPRGAILHRATRGHRYQPCHAGDKHKSYIDDVLLSDALLQRHEKRRATLKVTRLGFDPQDSGRQLSDHCPLIWSAQ